jgi:hypothetical protein
MAPLYAGPGVGAVPSWMSKKIAYSTGSPRVYLEGVAEYDWSDDATRIAYHTPGPVTRCSCETPARDRNQGKSFRRL